MSEINEEKLKKFQENPKARKIINYYNDGMTHEEIGKLKDIQLSKSSVTNYIKQGREYGVVNSDEQIQEARKIRKRKKLIENPNTQKIIKYYNQEGLTNAYEMKREKKEELPISTSTINRCITKLKEYGLLKTDEEIEKTRFFWELKENPEVQKIVECINQKGMSDREIYENKEDGVNLSIGMITYYRKKLKEYGLLKTDEEIEKARFFWKLKANPEVQKIMECINQKGMSDREIYEDKENGVNLSREMITYYRKELKEYGLLKTDEEIEKTRFFWELKANPKVQKIIMYHELGITPVQMYKRGLVQMAHQTIAKYIEKYIKYVRTNQDKETEKVLNLTEKSNEEQAKNNKKLILQSELELFKENILKKQINDTDIMEFAKKCISIEEYEEALIIVRGRHQLNRKTISKEGEEKLKGLEVSLAKACKIQKAIQIMKKGETNVELISEETDLSTEIVAIIKMKLENKKINMPGIFKRERAISEILEGKPVRDVQEMLGFSELEILDIEKQSKYRQIPSEKRDFEAQIKQDSATRIIVLATKLGEKPEQIAEALKVDLEIVEKYIENALKVNLIKEDELHGIDLLAYGISTDKERTA